MDLNVIRTKVDLQGWAIEAISPTTTSLTLLEQSDPKGWTNKTSIPNQMIGTLAGIGEFAIKCGGPPVVTRMVGARANEMRYDCEKGSFKVEYEPSAKRIVPSSGGDGEKIVCQLLNARFDAISILGRVRLISWWILHHKALLVYVGIGFRLKVVNYGLRLRMMLFLFSLYNFATYFLATLRYSYTQVMLMFVLFNASVQSARHLGLTQDMMYIGHRLAPSYPLTTPRLDSPTMITGANVNTCGRTRYAKACFFSILPYVRS